MLKNILLLLFIPTFAAAQNSSGILDPSRSIDWSQAGVVGGIPSGSWSQCGSTISAGASAATIQTAINGCAVNHYVLLGAGTFNLTNGLVLGSNVVLRGSTGTIIAHTGGGISCYSGGAVVCMNGGNGDYNGSAAVQPGGSQAATWSGGYSQGATSITLSSVGSSGISNGQYIFLDQANDTTPQAGLFNCETTSCTTEGGSPGRTIGGVVYSQLQVVKVTAGCSSPCTGSGPFTLTISPGLYGANWTSGKTPGAWWTTLTQNAGVENIKFDTTSSGAEQTIGMFNTANSWVSGNSFITTPRAGVWIIQGAHNTVQNNYYWSTQSKASLGYGVELDLTSDNLAVNNIMQQTVSPIMTGSAFGNAIAYNYQVNDFQNACPTCMYLTTAAHDAAALYNLWEGNIASGVDMDVVHGTGGLITLYRNVFAGFELGKSAYTMGVEIDPYNRYENIVGNVIGTPGKTATYSVSDPSSNGGVYSIGNIHGSVGFDSVVGQTLLRWANYDSVTAAIRFCGNSSDTGWSTTCGSTSEVPTTGLPNGNAYANAVPTLGDTGAGQSAMPASFIYASTPVWWPSGKVWPPIGPDVASGNLGQCSGGTYAAVFATASGQCTSGSLTAHVNGGHANSIPAMDCALNTMGMPPDGSGAALTFNPSSCYAASGGSGSSGGAGIGGAGIQVH